MAGGFIGRFSYFHFFHVCFACVHTILLKYDCITNALPHDSVHLFGGSKMGLTET